MWIRTALALAAAATLQPLSARAAPDAFAPLFAAYGPKTPGCALAVDGPSGPLARAAYGQADLEHDAPNTVDTVFEAGSVSKQFTAAAVLLLVADGRIGLGDDVRRYLPELPDYGSVITIDHLLTHTSGLRDWGAVEELAGWPRSSRVYAPADVLAIAGRQKALNYAPGAAWSYTNTGYNLLAIIVERVSGKPLQDFTRERLFTPLGMTHTQWRDDFRRVVPGRAVAYSQTPKGWEQLMPFEDAIGNGGLLTTVGDLLIWNRALTERRLGEGVTTALERPARLSDGRTLEYARGLFVTTEHGRRQIAHSGSTGGYTAWLARRPDEGLSIALLCNADNVRGGIGPALVAAALGAGQPSEGTRDEASAPPTLAAYAGWWRDNRSGAPLHLSWSAGGLRADDGRALRPSPDGGYRLGQAHLALTGDGRIGVAATGDVVTFERARPFRRDVDLAAIAGRYASAEADAVLVLSARGDRLWLAPLDRPSAATPLEPAYEDAFTYPGGLVRVVRGADGRPEALRLSNGRVWDLRAARLPDAAARAGRAGP